MYGKERHVERRKAAKEKEQMRWAEIQREEADIERTSVLADTLRSKGVNLEEELKKIGITPDSPLADYEVSKILPLLEEVLARVEKG